MNLNITSTTAVVALLCACFSAATAIDLEKTKESRCFNVTTVSLDASWYISQKVWFYPVMSRYELYHLAAEFLADRDPKFIREDEIYYKMCVTTWLAGPGIVIRAFGKSIPYSTTLISGMEQFHWKAESSGASLEGTSYIILTDNSTFVMSATCMSDGYMTWSVISNVPDLPDQTKNLIYELAKNVGFKPEFFTALRYDSCNKGFEGGKEEL